MDPMNFLPYLAQWLGVAPSSLLMWIGVLITVSNLITKLIPNDATGWLGAVRRITSVTGVYVSSRVTSGVTVADVAAASMATPPIPQKVEAAEITGVEPAIPRIGAKP